MKKSKFVLATLAAAVFATSAAGLAACSKSNGGEDEEYTITFDANGSYFGTDTTATTKEVETIGGLALQPAPAVRSDGYTFNGYTFTKDGTDTVETTYVYTDSITVYASWSLNGGGGQQQNPTGVFTITLDANGGTLGAISSVQTSGGQLTALPVAPTPPANKQFKGWFSAATGGSEITTDTVFTLATTIFAQWDDVGGQQQQNPTGVYTINLNANGGTSSVASVQTSGGKLTTLPPAPSHPDSKPFNGWFDAPSGGNQITTNTSFNGTTTIYAQWGNNGGGGGGGGQSQTTGFQVNGGAVQALVENTQTNTSDGRDKEYYIEGNGTVNLTLGNTLTFVVEGQPISAFIFGGSVGVDKSDLENEQSSFSITTTGDFKIMLRHYPEGNGGVGNWTAEFGGPTSISVTNTLPTNAQACQIQFQNGNITLYLQMKNGSSTTPVTSFTENHKLWMWDDGGDFFTTWPGKEMAATVNVKPHSLSAATGVIVSWSGDSGKTENLSGFEVGCTYVITLEHGSGKVEMYRAS